VGPRILAVLLLALAACDAADNGLNPDDASGAPVTPPAPFHRDGGVGDGGSTPVAEGGAAVDANVPSCAPSWDVTPDCGGPAGATPPDFGANVLVFDPSMTDIQSKIDGVYGQQDSAQFGAGRYAMLFEPGSYSLDVKIGFYTHVLGLGQSPDDVKISGAVRAKADWLGNQNATCNFWRGAENLAVTPSGSIDNGTDIWAISQGTHLRRLHVKGDMKLDDGGWSSGGFIADSLVDGTLDSGTQQQFLTRNDDGAWKGSNWNMVFVGDGNPPAASWPHPPYTIVAKTPVVRERPFLYLDAQGHYLVMVPSPKENSAGRSWASAAPPGLPLSIDRFYIAKPGDTAQTIDAALAAGKNLLFVPGIYHLAASLHVTRPGTVVLGLGFPTLVPDNGTPLLQIADVDGVSLAGLLLEAGPKSSSTLLEIGPAGSAGDHAKNPTATFDVHCRVGGADAGTAASCVTVNSKDVILDNTWLWRADHGNGVGWDQNASDTGLVVNGADVTAYGLFVEHFQKYETMWNAERGAVYMYQSEMPYDPPDQGSWMSSPTTNGYASYKVADGVTSHQGYGLGVYSVFDNDVTADDAIETPASAAMHHMMTVSLASGTIAHIDNGQGGSVGHGTQTAYSP
jgi:hypothetical protein